MRSTKASMILLLLHFSIAIAGAQDSRLLDDSRKQELNRLQAFSMIRQTAEEAPVWKTKRTAVQALTDAADLLWDQSPGQAATWLKKAWAMIDKVSNSPRSDKLADFFTHSDQSELRTLVLSVARKHDAKLASQFFNELSEKQPEEKQRGAFDDRTARSEQLLNLAQQLMDSKPEEAFNLARSSLNDGISFSLQNILIGLRRKSTPMANQLFDLALARFTNSAPGVSEAQVLSGYLFQAGTTFSANPSGQRIMVLNPAQQNFSMIASSETERAHRFLVLVYERLLTRPIALEGDRGKQEAQQLLVLGDVIVRRYPVFAPELTASVQGFMAQLRQQLGVEAQKGVDNGNSQRDSSRENTTKPLSEEDRYQSKIKELEDGADKESNSSFRNVAYIKAALATKPDDYKLARPIVEKISDTEVRTDAISFVLYRAALFFAANGEVEKATDLAPAITDVLRRAVVKIAIAQHLLSAERGTMSAEELTFVQQRALDLLTDIDRDLKNVDPSPIKARILLGKTAVLAQLDQDEAMTSLQQAVQTINKVDDFDLRNPAAPNLSVGGLPMSSSTVKLPKTGFDFVSATDSLVRDHFDQVCAIAARFTDKETAGIARLEAAKTYLRKTVTQTSIN